MKETKIHKPIKERIEQENEKEKTYWKGRGIDTNDSDKRVKSFPFLLQNLTPENKNAKKLFFLFLFG